MAVARATLGGSGEQRRRSTEMIKREEARETRDAARKHLAGQHFPEEPHAKRLGGPAGSNLQTQPPRPAHATIGKHGRQFPGHPCAGGRRRRQQRNTTGPSKLVWLARVCQKLALSKPYVLRTTQFSVAAWMEAQASWL